MPGPDLKEAIPKDGKPGKPEGLRRKTPQAAGNTAKAAKKEFQPEPERLQQKAARKEPKANAPNRRKPERKRKGDCLKESAEAKARRQPERKKRKQEPGRQMKAESPLGRKPET